MSLIRAVVVDPNSAGRLALREVDAPMPGSSEALVRVAAISLNAGEVRRASATEAGWRPGWDLAGTVEQAAADGTGPRQGARVVGLLNSGAWAELVAVPTNILAELPPGVSFAQAATLPIAGLTALRTLERGGFLLNRKVLITGATGGVGHLAIQLARQAGASVVASVRRPEQEQLVRELGAQQVAVGENMTQARELGPYHLILESIGGQSLANALTMLTLGGLCVNFGSSSPSEVTFDTRRFFSGGGSLQGFLIFNDLTRKPGAEDLAQLATMIDEGRLKPRIEVETPWTEVGIIARQLLERRFTGKAVLHVK